MASSPRLRSPQRLFAVLVGLAPVVALHTVAPGVVHETMFELSAVVLFSGPAVVSVLGIALWLSRLGAVWAATLLSLVCGTGLILVNSAEEDGSLWLVWWAPLYITMLLAGFVGEAVYNSWKRSEA